MTKIKFNTSIVFQNGISYAFNEVAEIENKLAKQLVENGVANNVEEKEVVETVKKTTAKKPKTEDAE